MRQNRPKGRGVEANFEGQGAMTPAHESVEAEASTQQVQAHTTRTSNHVLDST